MGVSKKQRESRNGLLDGHWLRPGLSAGQPARAEPPGHGGEGLQGVRKKELRYNAQPLSWRQQLLPLHL